jgi:hypothetical protein
LNHKQSTFPKNHILKEIYKRKTKLKSTSERKYYINPKRVNIIEYYLNPKRVHIIDISKDLDGSDIYTYIYKISGLKRTFESQVMGFQTWERIVLRTSRRGERLRELGI